MEPTPVIVEKPGRIGGWLLLPALALGVQPVFIVVKTLRVVRSAPSFGGRLFVIWPAFWFDLMLLIMVGLVSWAFFRKRSIAPSLFVAHVLLMWLCWAVISGVSSTYIGDGLAGMIFHLIILCPYMVLSKRVANTFVLPPDQSSALDRLLARISVPFETLYGFLRRQRWLAPVHMALFMVVMVVLTSAVRSLYLSGNLSETWRLISG